MKKVIMILCVLLTGMVSIHAQDKEESEKGGFKKGKPLYRGQYLSRFFE